jgi:NAD(P)-dependent dehydrogenase (short-subunit alcohol dehydrogenase family)
MGTRLNGRVALVTGGGRGVGRAAALLLAEEGASVVVNDLGCEPSGSGSSRLPADTVAAEIQRRGGKARANYDDVSTMAGAEGAVKEAVDGFGRLDILVTAAGVRYDQLGAATSPEDWQRITMSSLKAAFAPTKFACILFRQQQGGRIVMLTSDAGLGAAGQSATAAAGEGIIGLSRTVARDMGRYGVTCNAVSPVARTRLYPASVTAAALSVPEALRRAGLGAPNPLDTWQGEGHPDDPENVAVLVTWLCTEAAANVNGNVFGARGGDVYVYTNPQITKSIATTGRLTLDQIAELAPRAFTDGVRI